MCFSYKFYSRVWRLSLWLSEAYHAPQLWDNGSWKDSPVPPAPAGRYPLNKKEEKHTNEREILKFHFCYTPCQEEGIKLEVRVSKICKRREWGSSCTECLRQASASRAAAPPLGQSPACRHWCSTGDVCVMAASQSHWWNQDSLWYSSFAVLSLRGWSLKHGVSNAGFAQKCTVSCELTIVLLVSSWK